MIGVGSLVKAELNISGFTPFGQGVSITKDKEYIVRDVVKDPDGSPVLYLQGIHNPIHPILNMEMGYDIDWFREIEFPPPLSSEIKEALQAPVKEIINV